MSLMSSSALARSALAGAGSLSLASWAGSGTAQAPANTRTSKPRKQRRSMAASLGRSRDCIAPPRRAGVRTPRSPRRTWLLRQPPEPHRAVTVAGDGHAAVGGEHDAAHNLAGGVELL